MPVAEIHRGGAGLGQCPSVNQSRSYRSRDLAERVKYLIRRLANAFDFDNHVTRFAMCLQELADDIQSAR